MIVESNREATSTCTCSREGGSSKIRRSCLLFGKPNFVHDLRDPLARSRSIPLLDQVPAQGQSQLREFDRAAQIIGNTSDVWRGGR